MTFVDSSAWFEMSVPSEVDHAAAVAWFNRNRDPLLTTDYVIDETLTLLRARRQSHLALLLGDRLCESGVALPDKIQENRSLLARQIQRRRQQGDS